METQSRNMVCIHILAAIGLFSIFYLGVMIGKVSLRSIDGRIWEGIDQPEKHSTVALSNGCAGVIISEKLILTSAFCISNRKMNVLFRSRLYQKEGEVIAAESFIIHDQYRPLWMPFPGHDIALLLLSRNIPASYKPAKILPTMFPLEPGKYVRQAGFGERPSPEGSVYGKLSSTPNIYHSRDSQGRLIVGSRKFTGKCQGDNGGPLFVKFEGEWFLAGILSGGSESEHHGCFGGAVYTGVSEHQEWLRESAEKLTGIPSTQALHAMVIDDR